MRLLGALSTATLVYLVVGHWAGVRPVRLKHASHDHNNRHPGLTARRPSPTQRLVVWLDRGETTVAPAAFVVVVFGAAMVGALLTSALTRVPALAALGFAAGFACPIVLVDRRGVGGTQRRRGCWPDALRDLTTQLRAGASMHTALVELGRLGPLPLRPAFVRYEKLAAALDHRAALETVRTELADPLSDRIIEVLLIAFEQGTRVVIDVLGDLAEAAVDDLRLMADIETAQLETKLEARGAAVLPFVVLGLLCAGSAGYREFYATATGSVVIVLGGLMAMAGLVLIGRLGRTKAEPRVLVEVTP